MKEETERFSMNQKTKFKYGDAIKNYRKKNIVAEDPIEEEAVGAQYMFEITRYRFELINGEPKIVIDQIKAMRPDGTYIKFAKLKNVIRILSEHPVTFKKINS